MNALVYKSFSEKNTCHILCSFITLIYKNIIKSFIKMGAGVKGVHEVIMHVIFNPIESTCADIF